MKSTRRYHNDDDIFDERGLLRDGKTYRASMRFMDSANNLLKRIVPRQHHAGPMRVVDGYTRGRDSTALNRPGFRVFADDDAIGRRHRRCAAALRR